jgi:hypothetical protein
MRRRTARTGAALSLAAGLLAGCESGPQRTPYADNPLLQSRQPLLQSPGAPPTDGTQVAQSGPRMVVVPPPGLYQQPPTGFASVRPADQPAPYSPAVPTYSAPKPTYPTAGPALPTATQTVATVPTPVPAPIPTMVTPPAPLPSAPADIVPAVTPAAVTVAPAPPPVTEVAVRMAEGRFGHAADYTWLQGELDRHYRGHLELRYRPVSEDDPYGGKVRLEDGPQMAEFRPGDVIAVEGELLTDPEGSSAAPWAQYKRFHVRAVRLVERK